MAASKAHSVYDTVLKFYRDIEDHPYHRYKSWENCYAYFSSKKPDPAIASLHLGFYLASWGMYRGSGFLLQNDHGIHNDVAHELLRRKSLQGLAAEEVEDSEIEEILSLIRWIKAHYENLPGINSLPKHEAHVTDILATKILLGTLACVPAYDRFFVQGLGKTASHRPNKSSIKALLGFYGENVSQFQKAQAYILKKSGMLYPPMKLVDMYFWQLGRVG